MSYTPTEWSPGDTITAVKLNKLEQGIANGGGMVRLTETVTQNQLGHTIYTLDHTVQEIYDLIADGNFVYITRTNDGTGDERWGGFCRSVELYDGDIGTHVYTVSIGLTKYIAQSLSDYPYFEESELE